MQDNARHRGVVLTAFGLFCVFGAVMSGLTAFLLLVPGTPLDAVWNLNPRARVELIPLGAWGVALMATVCAACTITAVGVWRRREWGRRLAVVLIIVNLLGDATNAIVRSDPRTLIGVPIAAAMIAYLLSARARRQFGR